MLIFSVSFQFYRTCHLNDRERDPERGRERHTHTEIETQTKKGRPRERKKEKERQRFVDDHVLCPFTVFTLVCALCVCECVCTESVPPPRQSARRRPCASWTSVGEGSSSPSSTTTHREDWQPNRIISKFLRSRNTCQHRSFMLALCSASDRELSWEKTWSLRRHLIIFIITNII